MARITVYGDEDQVLYTSQDIHHNEKNVYFGVDVSGQKQIHLDIHVKTSACYTIMQTLVYFISICFISIYKVTVHQIK